MRGVAGYVLEEPLGEGGSGQVWRARARRTGSPVAIKLVGAAGEQARAAAFGEAALLQALEHPHLVRLHEVVPAGERLALVLDLAGAGSLAALLAGRGRLTPGEVVTALAPIGAALAHAHAAGVVHGDVSPGNILFTPSGFPLLSDLGLARLLGEVATGRCTPAFADPAVAAGEVPVEASDVFSLGAVAFQALTGTAVWAGDSAEEVLAQAAAGRACDVARVLDRAGVPSEMGAVIVAALSVDPRGRPTAAEFALDLGCSTEPIAVELDAGRARREGVRAEPAFTQGIRLPPPQLAGRWGRHRAPAPCGPDPGRGRLRWLAGAAALGAAAAGTWLLVPAGASAPSAVPPPSGPAPASAREGAAPGGGPGGDMADASAVLAGLDARRENAFATRDPGALAGVYVSGELLRADAAVLEHTVPAGCVLVGVANTYRDLQVTADGERLVIRAEVRLQPSRLRCATAAGPAADEPVPGSAAAPMLLTLLRAGSGYRIAAITPDPGPARSDRPPAGP